ncbi:Hypothetical protein NTJ_04901 [Nesidiocoris tenuis]|uniref:HTH OST-type domain-containing protein n=1 Tax=Nesidiocoris tenuis TaxID=355587 RepID=A0ABN7AJF5_9HEMI|nr:Hypothetical protein NTJ_04901 [Nesidiocoris tenuis]
MEEAEREASEVLHSLLSVPRIECNSKAAQGSSLAIKMSNADDECEKSSLFYVTNEEEVELTGAETDTDTNFVSMELEYPGSHTDIEISTTEHVSTKKRAKKKTEGIREERRIEDTAQEVMDRFNKGCECQGESCFANLNPETIYRHRLNIAELTKEEHDMYLMGLSMACLSDPTSTNRHKARQRLRSSYLHQGRKVCLSAFLYLENCTLYQLKRIRKHLVTHGVVPRVHGNHGKKPHNLFPLKIYQRATDFLKEFTLSYSSSSNVKSPVVLPADLSRKDVHKMYQKYVREKSSEPEKVMGYSSFRHFVKEQFPQLKFTRPDIGVPTCVGFPSKLSSSAKTCRTKTSNFPTEAIDLASVPVIVEGSDECQTFVLSQTDPRQTLDSSPALRLVVS